jgi:hypothetical protein
MEIIGQPPYHRVVGPDRRKMRRLTLTATHPPRNAIDGGLPPYDAAFDPNTIWHGS